MEEVIAVNRIYMTVWIVVLGNQKNLVKITCGIVINVAAMFKQQKRCRYIKHQNA